MSSSIEHACLIALRRLIASVVSTTLMSVRRLSCRPASVVFVGDRIRRAAADGLEAVRIDVREVLQDVVLDRQRPALGERHVRVGEPVASVLPSTRRYVLPNDVIVSPSASSTNYEPGMISSDPGVKWIWICLLMMARSFDDGAFAAIFGSSTFAPG